MTVDEYLSLPYTKVIKEIDDESGHYYYGRIMELDGCQSTGDTLEELDISLKEAMEGYIETKIEHNMPIPMPIKDDDYSGKFVLRIPKSLHRRLAEQANAEGVSLNQYAMFKLAL